MFLNQSSSIPVWAKAWIKNLTPKVNYFSWILLQNKILTTNNLCKRGFQVPNICILYMADVESIPHLFINYPFAQEIWGKMLQLWDLYWVFPSTILDQFSQWRAPSNNQVIKRLWSYSLPQLVWGISKEENN